MDRRALLALLGGSVAGIAGCASTVETDPTDTPPDAGDDTPTEEDDTPTEKDDTPTEEDHTPTGMEDGTAIDVELREVPVVGSAHSRHRLIEQDEIVPVTEVPQPLRDALREARDGAYETDTASEELLRAIDEFRTYSGGSLAPYVELDGTLYEFSPEFPTFRARLADEVVEEYDAERVFRPDEQDPESGAVDAFVDTLRGQGPNAPRMEYERSAPPADVEAFLDQYDYIEDPHGVSRIETTVRNDDPPYTITLRELTDEDLWGHPVVDAVDLDGDVVAFFEKILDSEHRKPTMVSADRSVYFTDSAPDAYFDFVEEQDTPTFVRIDGTVYGIGAGKPDYESVPVSVTVEEDDGGDRRFEVTVAPAPEKVDRELDDAFTFTSQGALPSVLWIEHDGHRHLLESPAYDKRRWRSRSDGSGDRLPINEVLASKLVGEEISATYTVPEEVPEGTYVSRGLFRASWSYPDQVPGDGAAYPFELLITVGEG